MPPAISDALPKKESLTERTVSAGRHLLAGRRSGVRGYLAFVGRVEDWRAGRPFDRATFPVPATSHAACGFPALRAPICFIPRLMGPIPLGQLSVRRVALYSC